MAETRLSVHVHCRQCQTVHFHTLWGGSVVLRMAWHSGILLNQQSYSTVGPVITGMGTGR